MNGAQALFKALRDAGLDTCFANPGTSEMQLVYEMGLTEDVRPVLCLQENTVTGAADGYARMAGKPAFTLLHVGGGLANGIANLHNAGRANTPMVNVVGANATFHQPNFPEHELIGGKITDLARVVSHWTREAKSASDLGVLAAMAARYARIGSGKICTLVAPTNCHWDRSAGAPVAEEPISTPRVAPETVAETVELLGNGKQTALLLGGHALREDGLELAGRIAAKTGAHLMGETMAARVARGEGRIPVPQVPYLVDMALKFFEGYEQVILVGALRPVATFAYAHMPTDKVPAGCAVWAFATPDHDLPAALQDLADALRATETTLERQARLEPAAPTGQLNPEAIGQSLCALLPEDAILVDEANTMATPIMAAVQGARRHDYLYASNGAAIGEGPPLALGAAVACPDRKVVLLQADGSGMYTVQALWSIAREDCDITIIVLKNDEYGILNVELARVREGEPTDKMLSMLKLAPPSIGWVQIAEGMGVVATYADTAESFHAQLREALETKGPRLIEAKVAWDLTPAIDAIYKSSRAKDREP
jgi:acetolactate synthase-1/2/3 large subunit